MKLNLLIIAFSIFSSIAVAQNSANESVAVKNPNPSAEIASFPHGIVALNKYLNNYMIYPANALNNKVEGTVAIEFDIETNGRLDNLTIQQSPAIELTTEVTRVLKFSPHWLPAIHDGHPIKQHLSALINFDLNKVNGERSVPFVENSQVIITGGKIVDKAVISITNYNSIIEAKNKPNVNDLIVDDNTFHIAQNNNKTIPQFPGGDKALEDFFWNHVHYPKTASEKKIGGRVFVTFTVGIDGKITNIKVLRSISPDIDEEAMRVVRIMPKWKPAIQDGKPISTAVTVPFNFSINNY